MAARTKFLAEKRIASIGPVTLPSPARPERFTSLRDQRHRRHSCLTRFEMNGSCHRRYFSHPTPGVKPKLRGGGPRAEGIIRADALCQRIRARIGQQAISLSENILDRRPESMTGSSDAITCLMSLWKLRRRSECRKRTSAFVLPSTAVATMCDDGRAEQCPRKGGCV
jgi:hypothetical protein